MKKKIFTITFICACFFNMQSQSLVQDISPGLASSYPHAFYPFKNGLVFGADNSFNRNQLYYSDGTGTGTVMLTNFPNAGNHNFSYNSPIGSAETGGGFCFTEIDSLGYFFAYDSAQYYYALYKTNGTALGTLPITSPLVLYGTSRLFKLQNKICAFISYGSSSNNNGLLTYDPALQTTTIIPTPFPFNSQNVITNNTSFPTNNTISTEYGISMQDIYVYNNKFFVFKPDVHGYQDSIFSVDISLNTNFVGALPYGLMPSGGTGATNQNTIIINNKLLIPTSGYTATPTIGNEPYYFDFTTNTAGLLKDINPYFNHSSDVYLVNFPFLDISSHHYAYFTAFNDNTGREMWVTDGTPTGTHIIEDFTPGPNSTFGNSSAPPCFFHGDSLYGFPTDTLSLITTTGINPVAYNSNLSYIFSPPTSPYYWTSANETFFLYNGGGTFNEGQIYKIPSAFTFAPVDTLNKMSCSSVTLGANTGYAIEGMVLRVGCNLYISDNDCNYTGQELFKVDLCSLFPNGIHEINEIVNRVIAFPNPTSDQFFIEANTTGKLTVDLYDVNGRHVFNASINDKENINVSTLENGAYTLTIKTADRVINKKLVILR